MSCQRPTRSHTSITRPWRSIGIPEVSSCFRLSQENGRICDGSNRFLVQRKSNRVSSTSHQAPSELMSDRALRSKSYRHLAVSVSDSGTPVRAPHNSTLESRASPMSKITDLHDAVKRGNLAAMKALKRTGHWRMLAAKRMCEALIRFTSQPSLVKLVPLGCCSIMARTLRCWIPKMMRPRFVGPHFSVARKSLRCCWPRDQNQINATSMVLRRWRVH